MEPRISSIAPFFYLTTLKMPYDKIRRSLMASTGCHKYTYLRVPIVLVCMLYVCVEIDRGWNDLILKRSGF